MPLSAPVTVPLLTKNNKTTFYALYVTSRQAKNVPVPDLKQKSEGNTGILM
jgi:hypothetical protein